MPQRKRFFTTCGSVTALRVALDPIFRSRERWRCWTACFCTTCGTASTSACDFAAWLTFVSMQKGSLRAHAGWLHSSGALPSRCRRTQAKIFSSLILGTRGLRLTRAQRWQTEAIGLVPRHLPAPSCSNSLARRRHCRSPLGVPRAHVRLEDGQRGFRLPLADVGWRHGTERRWWLVGVERARARRLMGSRRQVSGR